MTADENPAITRILYEAFNDRDFERVSAIIAPDAKVTNVVTGETVEGAAGFRQFLQIWASAFPDTRIEVTNIVAREDGAAVEFTGRGTNTGPLMTPIGEIPPIGRRDEQRFCDAYQITDGKIAGVRTYFDVTSILTYFDVESLIRQLRLSILETGTVSPPLVSTVWYAVLASGNGWHGVVHGREQRVCRLTGIQAAVRADDGILGWITLPVVASLVTPSQAW